MKNKVYKKVIKDKRFFGKKVNYLVNSFDKLVRLSLIR
jgi:hypothetical protein